MVLPPWCLVSPEGRPHHVADDGALLDLAKQHGLIMGKKKENLLRRLVDPSNKKVRATCHDTNVCLDQAPTACLKHTRTQCKELN